MPRWSQRKRTATPEELSQILANATAFNLTTGEKNQLSVDATIVMAHARQSATRRKSPGEQFIAQTLGLLHTPFGDVEREWVHAQLRAGATAIQKCRTHRPPRCSCWAASRQALWQAQDSYGPKSPQGWAALRVYEAIEALESASGPEPEPAGTQ